MDNNLNLGQHISKKFNQELESLRDDVMQMGGLVEEQLADSISAIINNDSELGQKVIIGDKKVNQKELSIYEDCIKTLAKRQPTASDLRLIISILQSISDLERVGDLAQRIGKNAVDISEDNFGTHHYTELKHLAKLTQNILRASLDAFARLDANAAIETIAQDSSINQEYEALSRQLITYMMEDPRTIKPILKVTSAARAFERIGDHSKNICEYVVYLVKGEDIRYLGMDEVRHKFINSNKKSS